MSRRVIMIEFDELLKASEQLSIAHDGAVSQGYQLRGARLWRKKDGTCTARVVWRHPTNISLVFCVTGLVIA